MKQSIKYVTYEHLRKDRANGSNCRVSTGLACKMDRRYDWQKKTLPVYINLKF